MMRRYFLLLFTLILTAVPLAAQSPPYTVLISFDGFRWDYANRGITPNLERLTRDGVAALSLEPVFPSKTFPNHISMVTGLHPAHHGIILNAFDDPFSGETYRMGGERESLRQAKWYLGEFFWETAERQGITTASYFWPGSELDSTDRRPTYRHYYDHGRPYEARVEGVLEWLQLPLPERPRFITLYFHETDSRGHESGPDSPEIDRAIARVDSLLGMLLTGLERIGRLDSTNVITVSDHGMTAVSPERVIEVEPLTGDIPCRFIDAGTMVMVRPEREADTGPLLARLKAAAAGQPFRALAREEVPDYWAFSDHPFIAPILLVADPGWTLATAAMAERIYARPGGGAHGYDNHHLDMHGLFRAMGPSFKKGYRTGTVRTIDVYPLLCAIYGIQPRVNIDGRLERIGFVLK